MTNFEKVRLFMTTFGQEVKKKSGLSSDKINNLRGISSGFTLFLTAISNIRSNANPIFVVPPHGAFNKCLIFCTIFICSGISNHTGFESNVNTLFLHGPFNLFANNNDNAILATNDMKFIVAIMKQFQEKQNSSKLKKDAFGHTGEYRRVDNLDRYCKTKVDDHYECNDGNFLCIHGHDVLEFDHLVLLWCRKKKWNMYKWFHGWWLGKI